MTSEEFKPIIQKYILPLLPIADTLELEKGSFSSKTPIEQSENASCLYLYPELSEKIEVTYRYRLTTSIPKPRIVAAQFVLEEILSVDRRFRSGNQRSFHKRKESNAKRNDSYLAALYGEACIWGICKSLLSGRDNLIPMLRNIIRHLSNWSARTYEGQHLPFGFVYAPSGPCESAETENYVDFLENESSAVFTDGVFSAIILDECGNIHHHQQLDALPSDQTAKEPEKQEGKKRNDEIFAPSRFKNFASLCDKDIGISCLSNGNILIFQNKQLAFAYRNGVWGFYDWSILNSFLYKYVSHAEGFHHETYTKSIYASVLDVSFAHFGGCLAIIYFAKYQKARDKSLGNCLLAEMPVCENDLDRQKKMQQKCRVLRKLVHYNPADQTTAKFYELPDKLRLELQSLDGAMAIDKEGTILAIGAILAVNSGSESGGRLAAAKRMAKFGLGIKISEDGGIKAYEWDKRKKAAKKVLELV